MSDQDTPPFIPPPDPGNSPTNHTDSTRADPANSMGPPPITPATATAAPSSSTIALGQGKLSEQDDRTMGMLSHILGGVASFIAPLIIWLIKKDDSPFVNDQAREAMNFQITVAIGLLSISILSFIGTLIPVVGWILGCVSMILIPGLWLAGLIYGILGGLAANKGEVFRYPFALRLIH